MKRLTASPDAARGAVGRITCGSRIIADRTTTGAAAWVRAGRRTDLTGWRNSLGPVARILALAGGAAVACLAIRAMPWVMWGLTAGWCWKAWRAAAPADTEQAPQDTPETPAEGVPGEPAMDPLLTLCAQLTGTARGVHLSALVTALHDAGADPRHGAREVRARLAQLGVRVRPSVRAPREAVPGAVAGVAQGVHRDDLAAVTGPLPEPSPTDGPSGVATPATATVTCGVAAPATGVAAPATGPATGV